VPGLSESTPIETPAKATESWRAEYDAMREDGGCFVLTGHPFLSGRPGRAAALERLIGEIVADRHTWVASLAEIATHVRSLGLPPRSVTRPDPAEWSVEG
jgi:peptidoglycan/xylan/chitin deacetylase (PgdA/CDA1 family)